MGGEVGQRYPFVPSVLRPLLALAARRLRGRPRGERGRHHVAHRRTSRSCAASGDPRTRRRLGQRRAPRTPPAAISFASRPSRSATRRATCARSNATRACVLASVSRVCAPQSVAASSRIAPPPRASRLANRVSADASSVLANAPTAGLCTFRSSSGYASASSSPRRSAYSRTSATASSNASVAASEDGSRRRRGHESRVSPRALPDARNETSGAGAATSRGDSAMSRRSAAYAASAASTAPRQGRRARERTPRDATPSRRRPPRRRRSPPRRRAISPPRRRGGHERLHRLGAKPRAQSVRVRLARGVSRGGRANAVRGNPGRGTAADGF